MLFLNQGFCSSYFEELINKVIQVEQMDIIWNYSNNDGNQVTSWYHDSFRRPRELNVFLDFSKGLVT